MLTEAHLWVHSAFESASEAGIAADARIGDYSFTAAAGQFTPTENGFFNFSTEAVRTEVRVRHAQHPALDAVSGPYDGLSLAVFGMRRGWWTTSALLRLVAAARRDAELSDGLSGSVLLLTRHPVTRSLSLGGGLLGGAEFDDDPYIYLVPSFEYRFGANWSLQFTRSLALQFRRMGPVSDTATIELAPTGGRYRLGPGGVAEDGVFIRRRVELKGVWERAWPSGLSLFGYAGITVWQQIVVKDAERRTLYREETDPAFVIGLGLRREWR